MIQKCHQRSVVEVAEADEIVDPETVLRARMNGMIAEVTAEGDITV